MNFKQAVRMEKVEPSGTREVFSKCAKLMEQNIPFTSLTLGEPDFPTPKYIVDACKEAIDAGKTHYVAENGIPELRKAICEKLEKENGLHYTPDEISVTTGVAMAMFVAIVATLNPGDEILVPNPVYVTYWQIPQIAQAKIVTYDLLEENDYQVDVEQIRAKITDKTKMLVTVSPSNPTGGVLRHESLVAMADIAKEHDLIVLSDEIYDHFVYDESLKLESIASLPGMKERTIVLNGFSKSMAMTGWRLGYIAAPVNFMDAMNRLSFYMTAGTTTFVQHAGVAALRDEDGSIARMKAEFKKRRDYLVEEIAKMKNFSCKKPEGAFYIFLNIKKTGMNSRDFCNFALEKVRLAMVPGPAFGPGGEGYARLSYATSMETLQDAIAKLNELDAMF